MVVHVVDTGEPSPEDFSISRSTRKVVVSLEEMKDPFPDAESEATYSDCAFPLGWVQL